MSEMKPGPELDALVAEKVLGWRRVAIGSTRLKYCRSGGKTAWLDASGNVAGCDRCDEYPRSYSEDLRHCADAAEEAREAGRIMGWVTAAETEPDDQPPTEFSASVAMKHNQHGAEYEIAWRCCYGDSPAHALALALLKAVGA